MRGKLSVRKEAFERHKVTVVAVKIFFYVYSYLEELGSKH